EHVVTLTVRDSAAVLDAIAGPELGSASWAPPPPGTFREVVERAASGHAPADAAGGAPGTPRRLRIAFSDRTLDGDRLHPDCVQAVRNAAKLCEELGHHVEEAAPAIDGRAEREAFMTLWAAGCAGTVLAWAER